MLQCRGGESGRCLRGGGPARFGDGQVRFRLPGDHRGDYACGRQVPSLSCRPAAGVDPHLDKAKRRTVRVGHAFTRPGVDDLGSHDLDDAVGLQNCPRDPLHVARAIPVPLDLLPTVRHLPIERIVLSAGSVQSCALPKGHAAPPVRTAAGSVSREELGEMVRHLPPTADTIARLRHGFRCARPEPAVRARSRRSAAPTRVL